MIGGLQTRKCDVPASYLIIENIKRQHLIDSIYLFYCFYKNVIHFPVGKSLQFGAVKDIGDVSIYKPSHYRNGNHCGYADKQQGDVLCKILIIPHISCGEHTLVFEEDRVYSFQDS